MKKIFAVFIVLTTFCITTLYSANFIIEGEYYGENIIVDNPEFCVTKVKVNNIETKDNINSNAFEIDLEALDLKIGEPVIISIDYKMYCMPKIINPNAIQNLSSLSFKTFKINRNGKCTFYIEGKAIGGKFYIQQNKWNKYITQVEINTNDSVSLNKYISKVEFHSGINSFRIKYIDDNKQEFHSETIKVRSSIIPIEIEQIKQNEFVRFSNVCKWELVDKENTIIVNEESNKVDLSTLNIGTYYLHFDNQTITINIK